MKNENIIFASDAYENGYDFIRKFENESGVKLDMPRRNMIYLTTLLNELIKEPKQLREEIHLLFKGYRTYNPSTQRTINNKRG